MILISKPDFAIGKLLAMPAALEALEEANVDIIDLVERHIAKDWRDLSDDDKRMEAQILFPDQFAVDVTAEQSHHAEIGYHILPVAHRRLRSVGVFAMGF